MAETKRMGKRDTDSAIWYLQKQGFEITADTSATVYRFDVTFPSMLGAIPESLSKRDLWMLARGHRIAKL